MISIIIFYSIAAISILSSLMVVLSRNPVYSILFLVLTFVNVSAMLLFLELEYLPLIFIVVYVGALAVLFLFVMMMLNIRVTDLKEKNLQLMPAALLLSVLFFFQIFFIVRTEFASLNNIFLDFCSEYTLITSDILFSTTWYDTDSNMRGLGFLIYSEHFYLFILSGYILLLAMLGTIILTMRRYFKGRFQQPNYQIMQDFNSSIKLNK